jgi:hypothetical protein
MAAEQNRKNFKCQSCDYSTPNQSHLKKHTNLAHLNLKNFECTQCSTKFDANAGLKAHIGMYFNTTLLTLTTEHRVSALASTTVQIRK